MVILDKAWLERLSCYDQLLVGFSGGLDSTVLLHLLISEPDCKKKLVALHIHHGVSTNADNWQQHCADVCGGLGVRFKTHELSFDGLSNFEERARVARYLVFSNQLEGNGCLLLAHHQDDQTETLLLNLFRGSGIDGLSAMREEGVLGNHKLFRPLLSYRRAELEHYAQHHQLTWIDDESNQDMHFARNFLRHNVIPLLQSKWPGVSSTIARTATHCQEARLCLDALALIDCPDSILSSPILPIHMFLSLDKARSRNILRVWMKKNKVQIPTRVVIERILDEVINARCDALPEVCFGDGVVRRYKGHLYLDKQIACLLPQSMPWRDFPNNLHRGNQVISAKKSPQGLLIAEGASIDVRSRQGGEMFQWRGQTKQLKKLLQEWSVPPWLRYTIPLVYINDQLVAVPGYAISDLFFSKDSDEAWHLMVNIA
jgi:tRNA(Ile)-lysidine synthase